MGPKAPKRRQGYSRRARAGDSAGDDGETAKPTEPPPPELAHRRPSFASPTRASLARHNPEILSRRPSPEKAEKTERRERDAGPDRDQEEETGTFTPSVARASSIHSSATGSARLSEQVRSLIEATEVDEGEENEAEGQPQTSSEERQQQRLGTSSGAASAPALPPPVRRIGGRLGHLPPRHALDRPVPRPLPAPGPLHDDELDLLDPRVLRFKSLGVFAAVEGETAEPELPPTPHNPGPEITTPPSGIHNTPGLRRSTRRPASGMGNTSSSPSQSPPEVARCKQERTSESKGWGFKVQTYHRRRRRPGRFHRGGRLRVARSGLLLLRRQLRLPRNRLSGPRMVVRPEKTRLPPQIKLRRARARLFRTKLPMWGGPRRRITGSRGLKPADPDAKKKKSCRDLASKLEQLKRDLAIVRALDEETTRSALTGGGVSLSQKANEIVDVLDRHTPLAGDSSVLSRPPALQTWVRAAADPMAFLPFNKPGTSLAVHREIQQSLEANTEVPPPVVSNHPHAHDRRRGATLPPSLFAPDASSSRHHAPPRRTEGTAPAEPPSHYHFHESYGVFRSADRADG